LGRLPVPGIGHGVVRGPLVVPEERRPDLGVYDELAVQEPAVSPTFLERFFLTWMSTPVENCAVIADRKLRGQ
jgi:hypothetical protein